MRALAEPLTGADGRNVSEGFLEYPSGGNKLIIADAGRAFNMDVMRKTDSHYVLSLR